MNKVSLKVAMIGDFETLIEPVMERGRSNPQKTSIIFYNEDGSTSTITAGQFHADAAAYARAMRAVGVGPDDLVILVLKHSQTLLSAFWGAMYLGAIASIFPFLTEKLDPAIYKERVKILVAHSKAKAVITFPEFKEELGRLLARVDCRVLSSDEIPSREPEFERSDSQEAGSFWQNPSGEKIAFLQHSSGTTGLQKGVALSHQAVLNQVKSYARSIDLTGDDVVVSWLPLYHDMGLIAGFVMPLVAGIPLVLMSPFAWVRSPHLLLRAVSDHHGTLVWLPNFAYNHSVRGIRERELENLDLSTLRAVINCSEPVRLDSHQIFLERFGPNGLKESALSACYAMAENTFAVTQTRTGLPPHVDWVRTCTLQEERRAVPVEPGEGATAMVSCGRPVDGVEVAIAGAHHKLLADREVGEIILRSNCMLSGYYRRQDLTGQSIIDGWYYTGDIGYLADGELYVSGRKKDMIISGGKNIFPQDLEAIANTVPGLYPGRCVAFGVMDERMGSESIVMVCEMEQDCPSDEERASIERDLRRTIAQQTEVALDKVLLVSQRWLIKTSSGKIARLENMKKYLREAEQGVGI